MESQVPRVSGHLRLRFAYDRARQRTHLAACVQEPPLRVVRAFKQAHGGALLHLHNLSGGVLGGDQLTSEIEVGPNARVQLTTIGATRLYRCRPEQRPARQSCHVRVEQGALLEYLPDQLIPFAGARYQQSTRIELAEDAGLFWWEIIAPGRLARGERFAYELLHLEMEVRAAGRPMKIFHRCERLCNAVQNDCLGPPEAFKES